MSLRLFLYDTRFLHELDNLKIKTQYVKITVLNWQEEPIQEIQGKVISGNVNLDGSSTMRRTATLSMVALQKENNLSNVDSLFALNKKCKIELGIVNTVPNYIYSIQDNNKNKKNIEIDYKQRYGEIIWFPLGLYVMFNPSIAHGTDGVTISMQLKDKMCLLNGDVAGQIHSGVDFTQQEEKTDGSYLKVENKYTLVYNLILELVHHWGNEELNKIIISEVPSKIKRAVKWTSDNPIFLYQQEITSETGQRVWIWALSQTLPPGVALFHQYQKGENVGFTYDDFTFPGELTCNAGDTITSVLDKIIGVLGNYEYFYDVDGNFIFRQKQNYLNMSNTAYWLKEFNLNTQTGQQINNKVDIDKLLNLPSDVYSADTYKLNKSTYEISDNNYTVSINNSMNFNNIKNDFIVWGAYKTAANKTIGCRFHLAIDKKPKLNIHNNIIFYLDDTSIVRGVCINGIDKTQPFTNIEIGGKIYPVVSFFPSRQSVDWREEIYYQMLESEAIGTQTNTEINNSYFQYYAELKEQFPKIFDLTDSDQTNANGNSIAKGYKEEFVEHPEQMLYFLDFIDENSGLGGYSVNNIGRRSKIIEDNNEGINCTFEPTIPDIVYIDPTREEDPEETEKKLTSYGQRWIQIPTYLYDQFATGGVMNSCFEKIKDLLYQYTHVNNSISITTIPIYHLEPGSRITVEDKQSGTDDDFIIQSISLPLDISSTMSINAYKALQKI